jgi:hypothetical protein
MSLFLLCIYVIYLLRKSQQSNLNESGDVTRDHDRRSQLARKKTEGTKMEDVTRNRIEKSGSSGDLGKSGRSRRRFLLRTTFVLQIQAQGQNRTNGSPFVCEHLFNTEEFVVFRETVEVTALLDVGDTSQGHTESHGGGESDVGTDNSEVEVLVGGGVDEGEHFVLNLKFNRFVICVGNKRNWILFLVFEEKKPVK